MFPLNYMYIFYTLYPFNDIQSEQEFNNILTPCILSVIIYILFLYYIAKLISRK